MRITHVVWDWNGTLLDDLEVCHGIINAMLERRGRPALSLGAYRQVQEFPVVNYYAKIFDLEAESFHDLAEEYMARYNRLWEHCGLTTGALETLSALRMAGVGQSMLTASRGDNLHRQLEHYGLQEAFSPGSTLEDHYAGGKAHLGRDHMAPVSYTHLDVYKRQGHYGAEFSGESGRSAETVPLALHPERSRRNGFRNRRPRYHIHLPAFYLRRCQIPQKNIMEHDGHRLRNRRAGHGGAEAGGGARHGFRF